MNTLHGYRILVVDDHESNRSHLIQLLHFFFQDTQYDEASNGQEAVDQVRRALESNFHPAYHFIFMDYMMPILNGEYATLQIQEILNKTHEHHRPTIITWSSARTTPFRGASFALHKPTIREEMHELLIELGCM